MTKIVGLTNSGFSSVFRHFFPKSAFGLLCSSHNFTVPLAEIFHRLFLLVSGQTSASKERTPSPHYTSYLPAFSMPCTMHNPLLKIVSETPTPRLPKDIYFKPSNVHLTNFFAQARAPPLLFYTLRAQSFGYTPPRKYFLNVRCSQSFHQVLVGFLLPVYLAVLMDP